MKTRPDVTVCAAITADGKLAAAGATPEDFAPQPGDVLLTLNAHEDPAERLRGLRARSSVGRVVCLGGPASFRRLFDDNLVAEIWLLVRPTIDGRRGAATLSGVPGGFFPASIRCRLLKMEARGDECLLRYRVLRTKPSEPPAN